jgi:hypothetical protein
MIDVMACWRKHACARVSIVAQYDSGISSEFGREFRAANCTSDQIVRYPVDGAFLRKRDRARQNHRRNWAGVAVTSSLPQLFISSHLATETKDGKATIKIKDGYGEGSVEFDGNDMYVVRSGVRIAKRIDGKWVSLLPGVTFAISKRRERRVAPELKSSMAGGTH